MWSAEALRNLINYRNKSFKEHCPLIPLTQIDHTFYSKHYSSIKDELQEEKFIRLTNIQTIITGIDENEETKDDTKIIVATMDDEDLNDHEATF